MRTATCIDRFRRQDKIFGYRLEYLDNHAIVDIPTENLKSMIKNNKVDVNNLTLSSNNKLIFCHHTKEEQIKKAKEKNKIKIDEKFADKVAINTFKKLGYSRCIANNMAVTFNGASSNSIDKRYGINNKYIICNDKVVYLSIMICEADDIFYLSFETDTEENYYQVESDCDIKNIKQAIKQFLEIVEGHVGLYELRRVV